MPTSTALKIGVDLGTSNTLVYVEGLGTIFNEPSAVAYDRETGEVIAVGTRASIMTGKAHDKIRVVRPLQAGVLGDLDATKALLDHVFSRIEPLYDQIAYKNSTLLLCCPSEITDVEKDALIKLAHRMGIGDVFIEQEIKAGAIGAGLDIWAPTGSFVVDIGGGSTDIGVLACGDLVAWQSIRVAGDYFDNEIIRYVKKKYGILIGEKTAEQIKIKLGSLRENLGEGKEFLFGGRHIATGSPIKTLITQQEVKDTLLICFDRIVHTITNTFLTTPPELAADINRSGIMINGGGALIDGIDEYLSKKLKVKVSLAKNPLSSVLEGNKVLLVNRGNYLDRPKR